jgi:hypothetical protein
MEALSLARAAAEGVEVAAADLALDPARALALPPETSTRRP